jgi:flagellar biosynthesis protein FliQ
VVDRVVGFVVVGSVVDIVVVDKVVGFVVVGRVVSVVDNLVAMTGAVVTVDEVTLSNVVKTVVNAVVSVVLSPWDDVLVDILGLAVDDNAEPTLILDLLFDISI